MGGRGVHSVLGCKEEIRDWLLTEMLCRRLALVEDEPCGAGDADSAPLVLRFMHLTMLRAGGATNGFRTRSLWPTG